MRRLPPWVVFFLLVLGVLMLFAGYKDRQEVGPLPIVLGVVWVLFAFAAAGGMFRPEKD